MTDFRAELQQLLSAVHELRIEGGEPKHGQFRTAMDRARAALAEPKPTFDEDWEMLKEQLWYKWKTKGYQGEEFMYDSNFDQAMDEARTALAEGAGVGVTDDATEEVAKVIYEAMRFDRDYDTPRWSGGGNSDAQDEARKAARAILARYGTHPRPIPVAERLPTEADCDAEGRCWWWYAETMHFCGYWQWEADAPERDMDNQPAAWLPAAAIPLPEQNNG
jgi:hypothetical protein